MQRTLCANIYVSRKVNSVPAFTHPVLVCAYVRTDTLTDCAMSNTPISRKNCVRPITHIVLACPCHCTDLRSDCAVTIIHVSGTVFSHRLFNSTDRLFNSTDRLLNSTDRLLGRTYRPLGRLHKQYGTWKILCIVRHSRTADFWDWGLSRSLVLAMLGTRSIKY